MSGRYDDDEAFPADFHGIWPSLLVCRHENRGRSAPKNAPYHVQIEAYPELWPPPKRGCGPMPNSSPISGPSGWPRAGTASPWVRYEDQAAGRRAPCRSVQRIGPVAEGMPTWKSGPIYVQQVFPAGAGTEAVTAAPVTAEHRSKRLSQAQAETGGRRNRSPNRSPNCRRSPSRKRLQEARQSEAQLDRVQRETLQIALAVVRLLQQRHRRRVRPRNTRAAMQAWQVDRVASSPRAS